MGNVGQVNVSVNANTFDAIKRLREFRQETKNAAKDARAMQDALRGREDFSRFTEAASEMQRMKLKADELKGTMVDLRDQTSRYAKVVKEQGGFLKQGAAALGTVATVSKHAAAALVVLKGSFEFAQMIKRHAEYVHSAADAWREFKAAVGFGKGGLDLEMEHLEKMQKKAEANIARQDKILADHAAKQKKANAIAAEGRGVLASATRERRVVEVGKETVEWEENSAKYGMSIATKIAAEQDRQKTIEEQREKAKQAAEAQATARKEAQMKKERDHQEAVKRADQQRRKDAEAMQKLRERFADFNKPELVKERDEMLRNVKDKRQHAEIRGRFGELGELERRKQDREILASRPANAIVDARTAEGWAQLRASVRPEKDKTALDSLSELRRIAGSLDRIPRMEVFKF